MHIRRRYTTFTNILRISTELALPSSSKASEAKKVESRELHFGGWDYAIGIYRLAFDVILNDALHGKIAASKYLRAYTAWLLRETLPSFSKTRPSEFTSFSLLMSQI
jgi:hypothetical protein